MTDSVNIRHFVKDDISQIAEIEKQCFSQPWSQNALAEFTENPFGRILTATLCGKVAGYITYSKIFEEIQIANVAVSPNFRRMGIGERLIQSLISYGSENGTEIITLEVRKSNLAARSLYEKCDFHTVGERKGFYSNPIEDAVLMNYTFLPRKE